MSFPYAAGPFSNEFLFIFTNRWILARNCSCNPRLLTMCQASCASAPVLDKLSVVNFLYVIFSQENSSSTYYELPLVSIYQSSSQPNVSATTYFS